MGHILWMLLVGAVIGALARFFMKGQQNIGMIWTIILGALGYAAGGWFTDTVGGGTVIQWIVGVVVAVGLITVYLTIANKQAK